MERTEAHVGMYVEYSVPGTTKVAETEKNWVGLIVELLDDGRAVVLRNDGFPRYASLGSLTEIPSLEEIAAQQSILRARHLAAMRMRPKPPADETGDDDDDIAPPAGAFRRRKRRGGK
jgi:hypothetical protein